MVETAQFPKDWKPDALGKALGGPFAHTSKDKAAPPRNLNEAIARDAKHTKTATVTAAARPKPKPVTPKSKRRR